MNEDKIEINHGLVQLYLEMSRLFYKAPIIDSDGNLINNLDDSDFNNITSIEFVLLSSSIIYSYMTIEALCNYWLYQAWKQKDSTNVGKSFIEEYGSVKDFMSLKNNKLFKKLSRRLEKLYEIYNIKALSGRDSETWNRFGNISKIARDFFIHPSPVPARFKSIVEGIVAKNKVGLYSEVATKIVSHFYNGQNSKIPDWVTKNTLLKVNQVEYITK